MPRKPNDDLSRSWKINMPAPLAGYVENKLWDKITNKPSYSARAKLCKALFTLWIAREEGRPDPHIPSSLELLGGRDL